MRKYSGLPDLIWGGNEKCEHKWESVEGKSQASGSGKHTTGGAPSKGLFFKSDNAICSLCGAWKGAYGLEPTPEMYVQHTIEILREVKRALRKDGVAFWNIGDSYVSGRARWSSAPQTISGKRDRGEPINCRPDQIGHPYLKDKDLCLIPFRVAISAQQDGWYVRSVIIWCLSGGTYLYVRSQKGDMPMMVRDLARLDPSTIKLWNGGAWAQLKGMSKSARQGNELEIVLRSGERISCTPNHNFPTSRGLLSASELKVGDIMDVCLIPEPTTSKTPAHIGIGAAWLAGLYIAEGSMADDTIQVAGHSKETERWERLQKIVTDYGGYATRTIDGNQMNIRLYGKVLVALLDELVSGHTAKDKCFAPVVWRYGNTFIDEMLQGYLDGDGCWDAPNQRWRLGFMRNYNLERDLRTACARLGYHLTLNLSSVAYNGKRNPTFRGEIRFERSGHWNEKPMSEIMAIRKARCREVYDIGVEDEPHLFALASGVLTHNSKPNPMPESVTDRPTESHEYILMLTKSARYYYDQEAVRTPYLPQSIERAKYPVGAFGSTVGSQEIKGAGKLGGRKLINLKQRGFKTKDGTTFRGQEQHHGQDISDTTGSNLRSVWTFATQSFSGAHFATYPEKLVELCVKAATPEAGCCSKCGKPWVRIVEKQKSPFKDTRTPGQHTPVGEGKIRGGALQKWLNEHPSETLGWKPQCSCNADKIPSIVLDPFVGSGTTLKVAAELNRRAIGYELSIEYCDLAVERNKQSVMRLDK